MLAQKYLVAVLGEADEGKTTTIQKAFRKLDRSNTITGVTPIWGPLPSTAPDGMDFSLTGITRYGLTGFVSRGDQIRVTKTDLDDLERRGCRVIVCACRKSCPDVYKAVAELSWEHDYSIVWIRFDRPASVSKDAYTDELSDRIFHLFR